MLLESWKDAENKFGEIEYIEKIMKKQPQKIKKQRKIKLDDNDEDGGFEEYYDYVFPEDQNSKGILKMLEKAHLWKKKQ